MFVAGAETPPPADPKPPQYFVHKASFLPSLRPSLSWQETIWSPPHEKDVMRRACADADRRFSYRCDYLRHNEESLKFGEEPQSPLWSSWLAIKEMVSCGNRITQIKETWTLICFFFCLFGLFFASLPSCRNITSLLGVFFPSLSSNNINLEHLENWLNGPLSLLCFAFPFTRKNRRWHFVSQFADTTRRLVSARLPRATLTSRAV